jgi:hypothetical protein
MHSGGHTLLKQCDVLVVRHGSIPVPIWIFSGTEVLCKGGSRYRSGRSPDWLKFKSPDAPAVKREAEEDWGER